MANRDQQSASNPGTVEASSAEALRLLQWTDLPCPLVGILPLQYIESLCVQSEQAVDLLSTAYQKVTQEAYQLRTSLQVLKAQVQATNSNEAQFTEYATMCVYKAQVVNSLYERVETPVCYLVQAAQMPRIMMKRRLFT